jgi:hypothetical protein
MHTPAVSLRLKRFRRRFGISAPRVVVRSELPRRWFVAAGLLLAAIGFSLAWFIQEGSFGGGQLSELRNQLESQQAELSLLRGSVGTGHNAVSMERAAQQQLVARIQALEAENAALKEDMLIFERLIPVVGQEAKVRIESFMVSGSGGGGYRYRLLLAYQPVQRGTAFRGRYEIVVAYKLANEEVRQFVLPKGQNGVVDVRHFLRREGEIDIPAGATLISVEARLLDNGKLVAKELAVI